MINGIKYHFAEEEVVSISFDGGEGNDLVTLTDTAGDESLTTEPGHATFTNGDGQFELDASNFEVLYAYGSRGGHDTALMTGSPKDDKFKAEAELDYAKMYGTELYHRVKFFDTIEAYSQGGNDLARLFGSSGDDEFSGQMNASVLHSNNLVVAVHEFSRLVVAAETGGNDVAILNSSDIKDELHAKPHKAELFDQATNGDVYRITARRFAEYFSEGTENGGDKAKLWDTVGDDLLEAGDNWARLSTHGDSSELLYHVLAYDMVKANGIQGGTNKQAVDDSCNILLLFEGDWQ